MIYTSKRILIVVPLFSSIYLFSCLTLLAQSSFTSSLLENADSWPGSSTYVGLNGQGFSPMVNVSSDYGYGPTDLVGLDLFTFFKDGYTDTASNFKLAIFDNFYMDLVGLNSSRAEFVGVSDNTIASTSGLSVGDPYSFQFSGLQLEYGSDYGAMFVTDDGAGNFTPVRASALAATYEETLPGIYDPITNYGGIFDYQYATSNFINSGMFGDFFAGFGSGGDAKFEAAFDLDPNRDLDFQFETANTLNANTWAGSELDPGIYGQGFSPSLMPSQAGHIAADKVGLDQISFFKDGNDDGQTDIKLVIVRDLFMDLNGLTTSTEGVVGISSNAVTTDGLAVNDEYSFSFDNLQLNYIDDYGAIFVNDDGLGNLTPIKVSALIADYEETSPGSGIFVPTTNYGTETDAQFSASSLLNSVVEGDFLSALDAGGDAKFKAIFDLDAVSLAGDFNEDGMVDAADYTVWRDNLGSNLTLPNDNGIGGTIGTPHYDLWVANYGTTAIASSTATSVPEPASLSLLFAFGLGMTVSHRILRIQQH